MEILFPPVCLSCEKFTGNENNLLCEACFDSIKLNNTLFCPVCQARIPGSIAICSHSKEKSNEFPFLLASATSYSNIAVRNLIHSFKYKGFEKATLVLENILADYLKSLDFDFSGFCIAAMPLHPLKQRKRGFNQAKLISKIVANRLNIPEIEPLIRIKNTLSQAKSKNRQDRKENIKNAFIITNPELVQGKKIIFIDDVLTSGATMAEASRTLKAAGAKQIIALVIARV